MLIRLENIQDKFDGPNSATTKFFDLVAYSKGMWSEVNKGVAPTPKIEEMSISGV